MSQNYIHINLMKFINVLTKIVKYIEKITYSDSPNNKILVLSFCGTNARGK